MKKLTLYLLLIIVLCSLIYSVTLSSFSDGNTKDNLTFTSAGSVYKNLTLPYWAIVSKAEIDLKGINLTIYGDELAYRDNTHPMTGYIINLKTNSLGDGNGQVKTQQWGDDIYFQSYLNRSIVLYVDNDINYSYNCTKLSYNNYAIDYFNDSYVVGNITHGGLYNKTFCVMETNSTSRFLYKAVFWNASLTQLSFTFNYTNYSFIADSDYPSNLRIETYDEPTYQNTSDIQGSIIDLDLNKSSLQSCINTISTGTKNCTINFTSDNAGLLEFSNLDVEYTPAINFTFYDEYSNQLIDQETFTLYLSGTSYTTSNNPFQLNISSGTYDLDISTGNYPERGYYEVNVAEARNIYNIYLINTTLGTEKTFYVRSSSVSAIENAKMNFSRLINGRYTTVAAEETDYDGAVTLYLDENYEYRITISHSDYNTKIINLETEEADYTINLIGETELYNYSDYGGVTYKFEPSHTSLQNNTLYNFTFTLNSSNWNVTNCYLTLRNTSTTLGHTSGVNDNSCFLSIELWTNGTSEIISEATYMLDSRNHTVSEHYKVVYEYEGDFSLKNFLDDITELGLAGFDNFGRMILAIIIIFILTALAAKELSFTSQETLIPLVMAQVWLFSYVNWFYLDFAPIPIIAGFDLKKYIIAVLITLAGGAFLVEKLRR